MSAYDEEVGDLKARLNAYHLILREAIMYKDKRRASRVMQEISILSMRFLGMLPDLQGLDIKNITEEEESKLKEDLDSLMSASDCKNNT